MDYSSVIWIALISVMLISNIGFLVFLYKKFFRSAEPMLPLPKRRDGFLASNNRSNSNLSNGAVVGAKDSVASSLTDSEVNAPKVPVVDPIKEVCDKVTHNKSAIDSVIFTDLIRALYLSQSKFTFSTLEDLDPENRKKAAALIEHYLLQRGEDEDWERAYTIMQEEFIEDSDAPGSLYNEAMANTNRTDAKKPPYAN